MAFNMAMGWRSVESTWPSTNVAGFDFDPGALALCGVTEFMPS